MLALAGCNCSEDCDATAGLAVWASTEAFQGITRQAAMANRRQTIPVMMRADKRKAIPPRGEQSYGELVDAAGCLMLVPGGLLFSIRLSALGSRLSALGFRLSAISYQLSAISYQLSASGCRDWGGGCNGGGAWLLCGRFVRPLGFAVGRRMRPFLRGGNSSHE